MALIALVTCDLCGARLTLRCPSQAVQRFWRQAWLDKRDWRESRGPGKGHPLIHLCPECVALQGGSARETPRP